jgi:hypothetical protein
MNASEARSFCKGATESGVRPDECEILLRLYERTGGQYWANTAGWLTHTHICGQQDIFPFIEPWYGISCSFDHPRRIRRIDLSGNNLTGSQLFSTDLDRNLSFSLSMFPALERLDLGNNSLGGPLPNEFTADSCKVLQHLYLDQNRFTGSVPASLSACVAMTRLYLHHNALSGTLPAAIGKGALADSLKYLYLHDNPAVSGTIPSAWGAMKVLERLYVSATDLDGSISEEFGDLEMIQILSVPQAMLIGDGQRGSGPLPPKVCAIFGEQCSKGLMDGCVVPACVSTKCKHCQKLDEGLLGGDWKPNN